MEGTRHHAARSAAWSGIAAAALFAAGNAIWALGMPSGGTPIAEVVDFYDERADRIVIGATLSVLAIAVFVLFAAAVRQVLIEAGGDEVLATTAFGGALLGMVAGLGAETTNMVAGLRARDGDLSDALAQSLFEISQILGSVGAGVGLGIFAVATAAVALRTGRVLPRPHALVILVAGIVLLSPLSHVNVLPGALMVLIAAMIGVRLLRVSRALASSTPQQVAPRFTRRAREDSNL